LIALTLFGSGCGGVGVVSLCRGNLSVAPAVLDFGAVAVGGSADRTITVQNSALCRITIIGVVLDAGPNSAYSIVEEGSALVDGEDLEEQDTRVVVVRYAPTEASIDPGSITINIATDSGQDENQGRAQLFGVGAFPDLFCDPPLVDFGRVPAGTSADDQAVLRNLGGVAVTVDGVTVDADPALLSHELSGGLELPQVLQPWEFLSVDLALEAADDEAVNVDLTATTPGGRIAQCRIIANNCDLSASPSLDADGDGQFFCAGDCDDLNFQVHPGAPELEDGLDNDCDGDIDEGTAAFDDDGDGFTDHQGDCDDSNPFVLPGPPSNEVLGDGLDNNCDGLIDFDPSFLDIDGDGFSELGGDCWDSTDDLDQDGIPDSRARYPDNPEIVDGIDNDCDGLVDEGTNVTDDDGDGACEGPVCIDGSTPGDCNDRDPEVYNAAAEVVDGIDNDCNGIVDDGSGYQDADGDGYAESFGGVPIDCDPNDPTTHPGAVELSDGVDNDCDGDVDEGTASVDDDGDGFCESSLACTDGSQPNDCNDGDPRITPVPMASEGIGDGIDNDCDGSVDEGTNLWDDDGDGYSEEGGDCDDANPSRSPGTLEVVGDGIDNDCDGVAQ
jgi:hypothetical protein